MIQNRYGSSVLEFPSELEIGPWYEAVCALWDSPTLYGSMADRARAIAAERYSEALSRRTHVDYFTSIKPDSFLGKYVNST